MDGDTLTRALIDQGKIIEAGFAGFRVMAIDRNATPEDVIALREVFFAGSQHLFACIINCLSPGEEPTAEDMKRISLIQSELDKIIKEFELRHQKMEGTA